MNKLVEREGITPNFRLNIAYEIALESEFSSGEVTNFNTKKVCLVSLVLISRMLCSMLIFKSVFRTEKWTR